MTSVNFSLLSQVGASLIYPAAQTTPATVPQNISATVQTTPTTTPQTIPVTAATFLTTVPQNTSAMAATPGTIAAAVQTAPGTIPQTIPATVPQTIPATVPQTIPMINQTAVATTPQTTPVTVQTNLTTTPQSVPVPVQTVPQTLPQAVPATAGTALAMPQTLPTRIGTVRTTTPQTGLALTDQSKVQSPVLGSSGTPKICDNEAPTPDVWKKHNITGFLMSYPNAQNTTIAEFARQNGVLNFVCGIGETCDAGQLCAPIPGPVWHVLYAIQQWHNLQESISRAVTFAGSTLDTIGAQLSIDLFPPDREKHDRLFKISMILSLVVGIMAAIQAVLFIWLPGVNFMFMGIAAGAAASVATAQAATAIEAQKAWDDMKSDAFSRWAYYAESIASWQQGVQQKIGKDMKVALNSGINDPNGFGKIMANGSFFTNTLDKDTNDIEKAMTDVVKARLIASILREKKAFVTVNSDKCDQGGPDGAFKAEDGWLSWCKDGKMMNIIYADGNKSGNEIYHGTLIPTKYGLSVEYMTTQAENCQIKYGGYNYDPYQDGNLPHDMNAECVFNLPVCWPSADKSIRKKRRKHGTVVACRENAALPI